jgi:hypothetical protein
LERWTFDCHSKLLTGRDLYRRTEVRETAQWGGLRQKSSSGHWYPFIVTTLGRTYVLRGKGIFKFGCPKEAGEIPP